MPSDVASAVVPSELVFEGRFSDGRTAASQKVRVLLGPTTLSIERGLSIAPLVWPLAEVESAEPLTQSAIDVLVHEPNRGGATLFVPEGRFVRELAIRAPQLTGRAQRWRVARVWIWLTVAAGGLAGLLAFTDVSPARWVAGVIPDKTRIAVGRQVIAAMGGNSRVCDGKAGAAALQTLTQRLSESSGSSKHFDVSVVDSKVINAFAAPGEQIVIMSGLLDKAESPDEVAGVLAHEMGHGIELHPETSIIRILGLTALTEFVMGGSAGSIANIGLWITQNSYSRQSEREADAHAVKTLKAAHISMSGFAAFFRRMEKLTGEKKDGKDTTEAIDVAADMFRTHPSTKERLAAIEAIAPYPSTPALSDQEWRAFKSICREGAGAAPRPANQQQPRAKPAQPAPQPRQRPSSRPSEGGRDI